MGNTWRAWTMAVLGAWFFISGWVFATQAGEFIIFGALILIVAIWVAAVEPQAQAWRSWLLAACSAWLAVMPWLVAFTAGAAAAYVTLVVGLVGVALAIWMATTAERAARASG